MKTLIRFADYAGMAASALCLVHCLAMPLLMAAFPLLGLGEEHHALHDALLLGYTHGRDVVNTDLEQPVPDCITRTYAAPQKQALVVQLLHTGSEKRWSVDAPLPTPKVNTEVSFELPGGVAPRSVLFASPDVPALHTPVKLDFEVADGKLRTLLPELQVHGTLILQYE